jgi:transposase
LHLALDLGNTIWTLAFATGHTHTPRVPTMPARDLTHLAREIAATKARCGLAPDAPVVSCSGAGRDGCWVHRALTTLGVETVVVDSARIRQGHRRTRRAKTDRLDAAAPVALLLRHHPGLRSHV